MNFGRFAWLAGVALLVMVTNIALSIVYMVVYSYLINPSHEKQFYEEHIKVAAPYCSIVAGIPLMFLAGWWVGRWWGNEFAITAALTVWLVYAVIDITVVVASGINTKIAILVAASFLTKLAAAYGGGLFARTG